MATTDNQKKRQMTYGPTLPISREIHAMKYRSEGESFEDAMVRVARALADDEDHYEKLLDILLNQRFLPAGRVQSAMGRALHVTPYNCFVSNTIEDSFDGIFETFHRAGRTMRLGGGIGYDFSTIRPRGSLIKSLGSQSSGPVAFMHIGDATCKSVASAGHRRGAQMGVLRIDYPDIEEFIEAKSKPGVLEAYNVSVAVTDEFMQCVLDGTPFALRWGGEVYRHIDARDLWDRIMRLTWDWAEPGVLFIDTINRLNNLYYCERIAATNPCAEQPLPPNGACLLGSFNLVKYLRKTEFGRLHFDWFAFEADIPVVVRAMDNVVDRAIYPLPEQEAEAKSKRRMGLGVAALANTLEAMGFVYGTKDFLGFEDEVLGFLTNECYLASTLLAREKGAFPLYDRDKYLAGEFVKRLDPWVLDAIDNWGIRNSHLTSIAPTGTISLSADNVSGGVEPVFSHFYDRTIQTFEGPKVERVTDYAFREFGVKGRTANECSVDEHLAALLVAQKWMDSAVSKTCNVGNHVTFEEFKDIYMKAWKGGAKGCTTFRAAGKRYGVLNEVKEEAPKEETQAETSEDQPMACFIDLATGKKSCE